MKKWIWIIAAVVFIGLVVGGVLWFTNKSGTGTTAASPSPTAQDFSKEIDALLVEYEQLVAAYKADTLANNVNAMSADEAKLGELSTKLSDMATKFSPAELEKYNAITAELGNE